ncbi:hypothetical protein M5K25_015843 [Dendrobium thyrsiflorum]|uniref:RNase H type-1 domain-containing protein n=1 Tax=Dendrobium thyrsiflorum TaxID=117978 RepID=A0ABD0UYI6_DENTH
MGSVEVKDVDVAVTLYGFEDSLVRCKMGKAEERGNLVEREVGGLCGIAGLCGRGGREEGKAVETEGQGECELMGDTVGGVTKWGGGGREEGDGAACSRMVGTVDQFGAAEKEVAWGRGMVVEVVGVGVFFTFFIYSIVQNCNKIKLRRFGADEHSIRKIDQRLPSQKLQGNLLLLPSALKKRQEKLFKPTANNKSSQPVVHGIFPKPAPSPSQASPTQPGQASPAQPSPATHPARPAKPSPTQLAPHPRAYSGVRTPPPPLACMPSNHSAMEIKMKFVTIRQSMTMHFTFKLNIDGSLSNAGAGCGGIVRNFHGDMIFAFAANVSNKNEYYELFEEDWLARKGVHHESTEMYTDFTNLHLLKGMIGSLADQWIPIEIFPMDYLQISNRFPVDSHRNITNGLPADFWRILDVI